MSTTPRSPSSPGMYKWPAAWTLAAAPVQSRPCPAGTHTWPPSPHTGRGSRPRAHLPEPGVRGWPRPDTAALGWGRCGSAVQWSLRPVAPRPQASRPRWPCQRRGPWDSVPSSSLLSPAQGSRAQERRRVSPTDAGSLQPGPGRESGSSKVARPTGLARESSQTVLSSSARLCCLATCHPTVITEDKTGRGPPPQWDGQGPRGGLGGRGTSPGSTSPSGHWGGV